MNNFFYIIFQARERRGDRHKEAETESEKENNILTIKDRNNVKHFF